MKYFGQHNKFNKDWTELPLVWKERVEVFD